MTGQITLGIAFAFILFFISLFLVLRAAGKGVNQLFKMVALAFVLKLVLLFLLLLSAKILFTELPTAFIFSLVGSYLVLLVVQVVFVLFKLKRVYAHENTPN